MIEALGQGGEVQVLHRQVSLDGIGKTHDTIRGVPGAFERVQETLRGLREMQRSYPFLSSSLSSVIQRENIAELREIHRLACNEGLSVIFTPIIFSDLYYNNSLIEAISQFDGDEKKEVIEFLKEISKGDPTVIGIYHREAAKILQEGRRRYRCLMGLNSIVLEHDGRVVPCVTCESVTFGNVIEEPLQAIWLSPETTRLRARVRAQCCTTCVSGCGFGEGMRWGDALRLLSYQADWGQFHDQP